MSHTEITCAEGWICEAHPDKPWPHDDCAGPGMLCRTAGCPFCLSPHEVHDVLGATLHQLLTAARAYRRLWLRVHEGQQGRTEGRTDDLIEIGRVRGALFGAVDFAEERLAELAPRRIPGVEGGKA